MTIPRAACMAFWAALAAYAGVWSAQRLAAEADRLAHQLQVNREIARAAALGPRKETP